MRIIAARLDGRRLRAFLTKASDDPGKERYRRAGITASTSVVSQGLTILIALISVPLTVGYLGQERYGVWLTISSLLTWMATTDFGLAGTALINLISEAHGRRDHELARQYAASALWGLIGITVTLTAVCLLSFGSIPWHSVFRTSTKVSETELHLACLMAAVIFCFTLPLNMLNSIYNAYQDGYLAHTWIIASNVMALLSLVIVTRFHAGLPALIFAISGMRVVVGLASAYYLFFHRYRWLRPSLSAARWQHIKRLFRLGSQYTVSQLAALGTYQSQPFLITQLLGPSQVLIFVLAQKIITLPQNLAYLATAPFISAFGEARVREDWNWIRHAYRTCMGASAGLGLALTVAVAIICRPVVAVWAGAAAVPDRSLVIWLSVYGMVAIMTNPVGAVLSGFERVGVMASGLSFCAIGTIGLGILFARHWGLIGLAAAMSMCLLVCFALPAYYRARQLLRPGSAEGSTVELNSQSITV